METIELRRIGVCFPAPLAERLRQQAWTERKTLGKLVRELVQEALAEREADQKAR